MELGEPDLVPVTDLGLDPPIVEQITGEKSWGFSIGGFSVKGIDAWSVCKRNIMNHAQACRKLDFDAVTVSDEALYRRGWVPKFVNENTFVDEWGKVLRTDIDTKTTWWVDGTVETPQDLENYEPPSPNAPGRMELLERLVKEVSEEMVVMAGGHTGFSFFWRIRRGGMDKFFRDLYVNPSFARKLMDKVSKACLEWDKAILDTGIDILFVTDDYAGNHGPFLNPKLFKEIEIPNLARVVKEARRKGIPVFKHSDGNLYPILDDIVNTGIFGLHPMEPGAMEIGDVKEEYGNRICLLGNVDCRHVLPYGTEEDVRGDVRRCIDAAAKGGGYVLTSSNTLHANVKVENVYTMYDEARKYGKYPLTK